MSILNKTDPLVLKMIVAQAVDDGAIIDIRQLTETTALNEELKFDSLSRIELAVELEDAFDIELDPDSSDFTAWHTVGDVCRAVNAELAKHNEGAPA